ncbi:MAG: hypothetical protein CMI55_03935 [Parcubacteria group bacterium]|jgi:hypothetical protein|nr:hypothetical protein [Parcubacteria group bacterium]|tara:strand:+ start:2415 stop:2882 length:468 start_codon:yes stop_codon:yes gene_type:complete
MAEDKVSLSAKVWLAIIFILLIGFSLIIFNGKTMDEQRQEFVEQKQEIISTLIDQGQYACCLEKPCVYCIEKTPGHGEGATCHCLQDVVEGRHPCGECIGEILEGHGNKYLSQYFAAAIAEEVGQEHLETLKQIIAQKYDDAACEINQTKECQDE